jgi:hypothetical protein
MLALIPRITVGIVFLLVVSACASVSDNDSIESVSTTTSDPDTIDAEDVFGSAPSGDGTLDCPDGQIIRTVDIETSGNTERAVTIDALAQWTSQGALLLDLPSQGLWSAVLDGSDVAIALAELNGDGTWVVQDVQTCGEPETGPAGIDGELDCANESSWVMTGTIDPTLPGVATAEEAVSSSLDWYAERYGGEIVIVSEGVGSLVVDRREQVVARAVEVSAGGWVVTTVLGCDGFEWVR